MNVIEKTRAAASNAMDWAKSKTTAVVATATAGATSLIGSPAFAQSTDAVDVSGVVTKITAQLAPIGLIGVAVLGVVVAVMAFKWVRRALS